MFPRRWETRVYSRKEGPPFPGIATGSDAWRGDKPLPNAGWYGPGRSSRPPGISDLVGWAADADRMRMVRPCKTNAAPAFVFARVTYSKTEARMRPAHCEWQKSSQADEPFFFYAFFPPARWLSRNTARGRHITRSYGYAGKTSSPTAYERSGNRLGLAAGPASSSTRSRSGSSL